MTFKKIFYSFLFALMSALPALSFNGEKVTEGPLTLTIGSIPDITNREAVTTVSVTLSNSGTAALPVKVEIGGLADGGKPTGQNPQNLDVPASGKTEAQFQFTMGKDSYSSLYPVHAYASFKTSGIPVTAHAIQIFACVFPVAKTDSTTFEPVPVPSIGALTLYSVKNQRVAWNRFNTPEELLPIGWQGSDAKSGANFSRTSMARGETRNGFSMHPPYRGGAGTMFADYRLKLPSTTPLKFIFFNAIRDNAANEPKSDGVTFRVWANDKLLYEKHTDSKTWIPGEVDLAQYAGQEILLRLESHPGPKKNTTCDSCFWGDPTVVAGKPPETLSDAERKQLIDTARQAVLTGKTSRKNGKVWKLKSGATAAIIPGKNGIMDGALAFGSDGKAVVYDGLNVAILQHRVGAWPSGVVVENVSFSEAPRGEPRDILPTKQDRQNSAVASPLLPRAKARGILAKASETAGRLCITHQLVVENRKSDLITEIWPEGSGLRIKISSPERITDISLNQADMKAKCVYYGHGYAITEPEAFKASGGGHNMSTSHVGMDFENGLSLLMASDTPPDSFAVDPATRHYSLHTHPDAMLTFVPGAKGIYDCAVKYRPLYDKKPSAGVAVKAGKFVFDYWGGRYTDDMKLMQDAWQYGLTNSFLIMHAWQRWGYDYRLPDIYPPMPSLGTLEDMQGLSKFCNEHGILWGLHDNYIDFYPDADDFSYDHITFTEQGTPKRAWLNEGREAQSYQFRPDHLMPFLKRNLALIKPALKPTASFVDVFTSANSFDYYDRQGQFHSRLETRKCWGDCFSTIRDTLGNNAPTTSEAGSDHLTGWLDGADCQFLELSSKSKRFHNTLTCADWERVPWFDIVNHTRFGLHGVGYSGRYQGDRARYQHGIDSDDYLSAEILTGHALMVDLSSGLPGAARKYWLAQEIIESLAFDEIQSVEYAGGNIHRQTIRWKSGAVAYVNRGSSDWTVAGHTLPQYGYYARNGSVESAIERINGAAVEWSRGQNGTYVNGRGFHPDPPLAIQPQAERAEYLGGREFRFVSSWDVRESIEKDLNILYQFTAPMPGRRQEFVISGGGKPATATSKWQGRVTTGENWTIKIPTNCPAGKYKALVCLYEPGKGRTRRYRMIGDEDSEKRYRVGTLLVEGNKTNITGVTFQKLDTPEAVTANNEYNKAETDFGTAITRGAFRCQKHERKLIVTPLPKSDSFQLTLRPEKITGYAVTIKGVEAMNPEGSKIRDVPFKSEGNSLVFATTTGEFAYQVIFEARSLFRRLLN